MGHAAGFRLRPAASQQGKEEYLMENLLGLAIFGIIAWWLYKSGKRIGSRKGYHVGRSRSRRRR